MRKEFLEAGLIVNTHGVRGAVMIRSYCDSNAALISIGTLWIETKEGMKPLKVTSASEHRGMVLAKIEGVDDIDAAVRYKNRVVFAKREDVPIAEGAHFIADLIGLPVINADTGKVYGTLTDVIQHGQDLYEIETASGTRLMPAVPEFVREIDLEKGVFVTPIEGIFDEI